MSDTHQNQEPETSAAVEVSGQIMVAAIIVLFMVIVFILFLRLYARWFWSRRQPSRQGAGRRRFVFAPNQDPTVALHNGLEASIIRSLPVVVFHPEEFKDGLECAVCLCEVEDGEKARLLPKCNHGFHLECIDMWFQSHSTCPLCRNTVGQDGESTKTSPSSQQQQEQSIDSSSDYSTESHSFPTNVLFWDNQTQVNTGASAQVLSAASSSSSKPDNGGMLVIDIPTQLSTTSEEMKSPTTTTRLGQLRRLLSREKRPVIPLVLLILLMLNKGKLLKVQINTSTNPLS